MLKSLLNYIQKKYSRNIDERLNFSYFFSFCFEKSIALLRGLLRTRKNIFIDKNVILKVKSHIHFGKNLRLCENVRLDALSENGIYFGDDCSVGINTRIECSGSLSCLGKGFKCGNNCGLGTDSSYVCACVNEVGNDVIVGNFVYMHSENHN